jgi:hypothetical protein
LQFSAAFFDLYLVLPLQMYLFFSVRFSLKLKTAICICNSSMVLQFSAAFFDLLSGFIFADVAVLVSVSLLALRVCLEGGFRMILLCKFGKSYLH